MVNDSGVALPVPIYTSFPPKRLARCYSVEIALSYMVNEESAALPSGSLRE